MSITNPSNVFGNYPYYGTQTLVAQNSYTNVASGIPREYAYRLKFGEHKKCAKCPKVLTCQIESLPEFLGIAATLKEHKEGFFLPCVEKGKVKLVVIKPEETSVGSIPYWISTSGTIGSTTATSGLTLNPTSTTTTVTWDGSTGNWKINP